MSSLLSRSRSLRKPAGSELGQKKEIDTSPDTQSNARPASASPSRLPLKGTSTARHTRAASTAVSKTDDTTAPAPRSRPISGVFGQGRSASVRQPTSSSTASSSTTTTSRPPITTRNRPPAARPTSASGPSPASSRPTTSSGLPSSTSTSAQPRGHTRTKSSATALTTSTILRPPSQTSSSTTATTTTQPTLRQPTSSTSRPLSLHARAPSSSVSSSFSTSTALPPRKRAPTTTSSTPDTTTTSSIPHSPLLPRRLPGAKPAFTTLQQHFTPAKSLAPKPLTSTFLAPPSPSKLPTNVAISAETARLQTELLQLHLLHRGAVFVRQEWEASAREKLGSKFDAVVRMEKEVGEEERRVVGGVNVAALLRWAGEGDGEGDGQGRGGLDEKVGLLDGVLTTVWELGERGGRYTRLVRRFERWVGGVREIISSREGLEGGGEEVRFITDLDASWKADCEGLARKLGVCKGTIGVLSQGRETREVEEKKGGSSSLDRILEGVGQLVEDMLTEMELMMSIEREAVREENEWVKRLNGENEEEDRGAAPRAGAGAIWRAF
ncbi:hypothetical protein GE09DRAFT_1217656 [Coniochaeta sp. 2T2.1]|nr:hypothetical protein GE09DRAFT_1217656 [Coniochaeta sp. 2T2.1]